MTSPYLLRSREPKRKQNVPDIPVYIVPYILEIFHDFSVINTLFLFFSKRNDQKRMRMITLKVQFETERRCQKY